MKENILVVVIVIFTLNVNAQNVKFGVKGGLNISSIYGSENSDVESRYSFHIGGLAEVEISEKLSFQPEVVFSSQGSKFNISGEYFDLHGGVNSDFFNIESTSTLNYINIPLILKYYVFDGFSLEFGPQVGYLLSVKTETNHTVDGEIVSEISKTKDGLNVIDFGVNIGLGYKLQNGIFFNSRFNLGLNAINKKIEHQLYYKKHKNEVLQFSVGYFFN